MLPTKDDRRRMMDDGRQVMATDNIFFYSYDMYSKCHSMYLKWTYWRNFGLGKLPSKYIINSIDTIRLNVCHNELFLPNL